ncbi:type IV secretory system conjugative DNA transfer family protein [Pseudomonas sp. GXZC]|uniref:type IV secretory system conjugative DNA transfer family protein n=1 Tax=Pseudomonas sp. GXZC TaxID=3003351 RepID=UPI0022AB3B9D|nr:type IV secretory system conjugative DNA transfer family protein [Pseudomonas sp. GXZC]WAT32085.1 type IV secretory system conjugative DNA transfer family protein [Pseudomonas sp. GXZC]
MKTVLLGLMLVVASFHVLADSIAQEEAISPEQALLEVKKKAKEAPSPTMDDDKRQELARIQLMSEAGRNYGVQLGRYNRWLAQARLLDNQAVQLDQSFPFGRLYLRSGTLQPPILDSAEDYRAIEDDGRLRKLVDKNFRTMVQARFRNTALTWRDFLLPDDMVKPPLPRETLLPRTSEESERWDKAMREGWEEGRSMAIDEADLRLEALQRGFRGMVLYRLLALHGMIDPPQVIERRPGEVITSESGDELLIGVREEIISKDAYFVSEPGRWKALDYGFKAPGEK